MVRIILICSVLYLAPAAVFASSMSLDNSADFQDDEISIIKSLSIDARKITAPSLGALEKNKIEAGRVLFFSSNISPNQISCASCHNSKYLGDNVAQTRQPSDRRAPPLQDLEWRQWLFWDGRAASLEGAVLQPLTNKVEVAATVSTIRRQVEIVPALRKYWKERASSSCPHVAPIIGCENIDTSSEHATFEAAVEAIAAYLRTLQSGPSRFDRYVQEATTMQRVTTRFESSILYEGERRGLRLFIGKARCVLCHNTWRFSDGNFHNLRLLDKSGEMPIDSGRLSGVYSLKNSLDDPMVKRYIPDATKVLIRYLDPKGENFGQFMTPGLRNISKQRFFMHQGQFSNIREVLEHYSNFQKSYPGPGAHDYLLQPLHLTDSEMEQIESFLRTLDSD